MLIGSARMNELGQLEGGQPGDQNKKEVSTQEWYLHQKGWYVIRAKSPLMRQKIADDVLWGCKNEHVGYSYWDHCYTLFNEAQKYGFDYRKVKIPCETNCAKFILGACRYAGSKVKDFYTGDAVERFRETGEFEILTDAKYCNSPDNLLKGDILVTRTKGHIVAVLEDGTQGVPYRIANCISCNIREGGSVNYAKVSSPLKPGTRVTLLGWAESGWGRVRVNGVTGYVSPVYLEELPKAICKGGSTWLRDKAGKDIGKQITAIPKDETVHITGETEKIGKTPWYEVVYKNFEGWASGNYIKPI